MAKRTTGSGEELPETPWPGQRENTVTPHPDPTELTTIQLRYAEAALRREIQALADIIGVRLDAMDLATKTRLDVVNKFPSDLDRAVTGLTSKIDAALTANQTSHDKDIQAIISNHNKDIESLHELLKERDIRFKDAAEASQASLKLALDAPAAAAEKVEKSTERQLTSLRETMKADKDNADKVNALVISRLDRMEAQAYGSDQANSRLKVNGQLLVGIIGLLFVAVGIVTTALLNHI